MALRRLNDISVDPEYLPKKPETQEHRTAIDYVLKVPDGKIVFWTGRFYICMTFDDFDVHVKNEQIERKIMKTKQHKHSARAFKSLADRFLLDNDFVCLKDQSDELGKTAVDWVWHSKQLIRKLKRIEDFTPYEMRDSQDRYECLNILREAFLEVRYDMLRTVVSLILDGCFEFDHRTYRAYLEEFAFARTNPLTYLNDSCSVYTGIVSSLLELHPEVRGVSNTKIRRMYEVYLVLLGRLKNASELSFVQFAGRYRWFTKRDHRIFYCSFMLRFGCSPACTEEIFLSLLVPYQEPFWDTSDLLGFIRDVFLWSVPLPYAKRKFIMLTNGSFQILCSLLTEEMREWRRKVRQRYMDKSFDFLLDDTLTEIDLLGYMGLLAAAETEAFKLYTC